MSDAPVEEQDSSEESPAPAAFVPWAEFSKDLNKESSVARRNLLRQQWVREQGPAFVSDYAGDEPTAASKQSRVYREWKSRRDYAQKNLDATIAARLPLAAIPADKAVTGLGLVDSTIADLSDLAAGYVQGVKQTFVNTQLAAAALRGDTDGAARLAQVGDRLNKDYKTGLSAQSIEDQRRTNELEADVYAKAGVPLGQSDKLPAWAQVKLGLSKLTTNFADTVATSMGSNPLGTAGTAAQIVGAGLIATGAGAAAGVPLVAAGKVASVVGGSVAGGGQTGREAFDNIMALSPAVISASPAYGALYSQAYAEALAAAQDAGSTGREAVQSAEATARATVASRAAVSGAAVGGVLTAGLEAIGAKFGQGAIAGQVGKTVARATAQRTAVSSLTEGLQETGSNVTSNELSRGAGDTRGTFQGSTEAFIQGAGTSLGTSAGTVGVKSIYGSATSANPAPPVPPGAATPGAPSPAPSAPASSGVPGPAPVAPVGAIDPTDDPTPEPRVTTGDPAPSPPAPGPEAEANPADGTAEAASGPVVPPVDGGLVQAPRASEQAPADAAGAAATGVPSGPISDPTSGARAIADSAAESESSGVVDGTAPRVDGASGSAGPDVARSPGIPERGVSTPLGSPDAQPATPSPEGRVPGVVSGAEPDKSVGKYNPTETGIFPGDEAPTRALTEISGRVTSEAVLRVANDHYNSYKKYASSVNNFFGESKGYIIPKAQFVREFFSNIAATALQQGRELAPSLAKNAQDRLTEARADSDFASTDRRVRGDRREASGWLTPEARWQQTPEQNLARVQDVITSMPGWRGEALRALQASGALTVVSNSAALPGPLASEVAAIQAPGGRVGGLFAGGRAYIIADSTGSEFVFARALHEVGVHGGLQMLIGSAKMTALADRIRALATYTFEASAKFGAGRSKEGDNEVVAHFMENMARREARGEQLSADSKLGKLWADIKNGVTDGLKKLFNSGDIRELTAKEIYELALGALAQRAAPVTPIAAPLESAPAPSTPALKTVRRGRPPKPVDESVVGEANFDNDLKEAEIDALTARVAQNLKPPPPVNLSPVADALATINARGVPAEMELARRMAAVGDPMLNGTLRQMAKNPEKYTQYEDATDVRGVQFSVSDIMRLQDENGNPLETFAQYFQSRIKAKDRTNDDVERIAKEVVDIARDDPASMLPVVIGERLSVDAYLRMPDGLMYDPANIAHLEATDLTKRIHDAKQNGSLTWALAEEASTINKERAEALGTMARDLSEEQEYTNAERAMLLDAASKYTYEMHQDAELGLVARVVNLTAANRKPLTPITGRFGAFVLARLRVGGAVKAAFVGGAADYEAAKRSAANAEGLDGWVTYPQTTDSKAAKKLSDSVSAREWCTGNVAAARKQLRGGNFNVYYVNGEAKIAIRQDGESIGEPPRGSLPGQVLTPEESLIAEKFLRDNKQIVGGEAFILRQSKLRAIATGTLSPEDAFIIMQNGDADLNYSAGLRGVPSNIAQELIRLSKNVSPEQLIAAGHYNDLDPSQVPADKVRSYTRIIAPVQGVYDLSRATSVGVLPVPVAGVVGELILGNGNHNISGMDGVLRVAGLGGYDTIVEGSGSLFLRSIMGMTLKGPLKVHTYQQHVAINNSTDIELFGPEIIHLETSLGRAKAVHAPKLQTVVYKDSIEDEGELGSVNPFPSATIENSNIDFVQAVFNAGWEVPGITSNRDGALVLPAGARVAEATLRGGTLRLESNQHLISLNKEEPTQTTKSLILTGVGDVRLPNLKVARNITVDGFNLIAPKLNKTSIGRTKLVNGGTINGAALYSEAAELKSAKGIMLPDLGYVQTLYTNKSLIGETRAAIIAYHTVRSDLGGLGVEPPTSKGGRLLKFSYVKYPVRDDPQDLAIRAEIANPGTNSADEAVQTQSFAVFKNDIVPTTFRNSSEKIGDTYAEFVRYYSASRNYNAGVGMHVNLKDLLEAKVDGDIFRQFRDHTGPWKDQGVEFSVDYREALKPLNKTLLGDRLTYGYQAVRAALYDPAARAVDWFRTLPGGNQDAMLDEFRTAPNVYRYTSDKFREEYVEPILTNIRTIARQHGVTVDQVTADVGHALTAIDVERVNDRLMANDVAEVAAGTLTQAKAAQRVNSILAPDGAPPPDTANKELGVAGGMSNPQAEAVLLRFALKYPGSAPLVDAIQDNVYDMNSRALARSVETGMHTPHAAALFSNPQAEPALQRLLLPNVTDAERDAAAAAVRTTYVPMNSDAITVEAERADGLGGSSKLGGTAIQRAEGRGSLPLDGLNASLRSVDGVLRHAAYQPFKRLLALAWDSGLAANSNDPRKTSEALGFSLEKANLPGLKGDVVYYRDAGRTQAFHWNDRNVGSAVSGSNTQTEGTVIGDAMRYVVRKFSALATVYNPFFSPPNALKDIGEKLLRLGSANVKDVMGMPIRATGDIAPQLEAARYLPAAAAASFRRFLGSKSQATQADLYLEEFLANGGSSLFGDSLKNGQGAASAIAAQAKDGYSKPDALIKAVGEYTTAWNDSFENISALMAYTYFRNHNATPKAAAAGALELMNFGKRGTLVKTLGTTIPFAGPALIGAANLVNDMLPRLIDKTDKSTGMVVQSRSVAGATTFAALVVGLTGVALAITADDEDKDPELGSKLLNGVPQSTLERSLPIKVGDMYVKAPIPFGSFMLAWGAAVEAAKYVRNEISGSDALKAGVVENAVKHLTPFKPPQFKAQDAPLDYAALSAAGIFTPLYTASTGATTFNPARQVPLNKQKTAAEQASVSTAPEYVAASDALRNVVGLDVRPAVLKQLVDGYSPGLLGMMKRSLIDNPNKERQGKPTVNPLLSPYIMDAENPFAVSTKLKEYQLDAERAEREGSVKDSEWVKSVKSEDGRALRARKGVKDFAVLARLDKAHEVEQRRLIAEYRRRHNLGVQQ